MIHVGIGRRAIAADVYLVPISPMMSGFVAGGQGSCDEDEVDVFTLFHGSLFHGDEYLIVLFNLDQLIIAVLVVGFGIHGIEGGYRVAMDKGCVCGIVYPDLMTGEDHVMSFVRMLDGNGRFDGAFPVDGLGLVIARTRCRDDIDSKRYHGDDENRNDEIKSLRRHMGQC